MSGAELIDDLEELRTITDYQLTALEEGWQLDIQIPMAGCKRFEGVELANVLTDALEFIR